MQAVLAEVAKPTPSDHGELSTVGGGGSPAPPAGATWFGRFVIEGRLGAGGMGEVFRARDGQRPIALKLMRPEIAADPRHRLMFVTEAQLAARLRHRNLVRLHDFGNTNGLLWMALDLVEGLPLDRLLDGGALPPVVAGHVALELLDALAYVHAHAMVHRDVSAANVLVSTAGAIKLSDFGVAKLSSRSMTRTNEEKGKPSYMAPEQLREHAPKGPPRGPPRGPIDGRVDLFAVGVLLYRMTEGEAPFSDVGAWLRAGAPRTASGPLAAVIARAMQPDRRERFADAKSMAAAILRDLPGAADGDPAGLLAARVRDCAAVATPMADFDRLIIAALGAQSLPPLDDDSATALDLFSDQMPTNLRGPAAGGDDDADVETRRGALSLAALVPLGDSFSESISTQMRQPSATLADDAFGEEATT
ncbi:MAG TPA: serine/threonine-protein kinase, partial [Polyangia bacterium]